MPIKNEHSARIKDPSEFEKFARKQMADGVDAIYGIKDGKTILASLRFDAKKFTPEEARAWLSKNGFKAIEFAPALNVENEEEAVQKLTEMVVPQFVDFKLESLSENKELTREELDGGFRNVKVVALKAGRFNRVPYSEEVVKAGAQSWVKQPHGRQGYFKMNHGNDVLKRAGPIEKSYWCDEKGVVIHEGKITVPEFVERWDAGVLDTTSVEMGVAFNLEKSKPGKLIPESIHGTDNAFVERPACKTCGTQELAILESYIEDRDLVFLSEEELSEFDFELDYDLTNNVGKGDNSMKLKETDKDDKSFKSKVLELLGINPEELEDKPEDKKEEVNMKDKTGGSQSKSKEKETDLATDSNQGNAPDATAVAKLTAACKAGDIAACGELKKMGVKMEEIGVELKETPEKTPEKEETKLENDTKEGMVEVDAQTLETIKTGITAVLKENKELKTNLETVTADLAEFKKDREAEKKVAFESEVKGLRASILEAERLIGVAQNQEALKQGEKEKDADYKLRLESQKLGYDAVMKKLSIQPRPKVDSLEFGEEEEEEKDTELEELENEMNNLFLGAKPVEKKGE